MEFGFCSGVEGASDLLAARPDFLEVNVQGFLIPQQEEAAFAPHREAAGACPVPLRAANCFLPGALRSTGPEVDLDAILAYAKTAFARAEALGIETIVYGSGGSRALPEGFPVAKADEQFGEILVALGPCAAERGVTVVVEPLNRKECNFINSLADGARLVEGCGHPAIRLLADIYHMGTDGEAAGELARFAPLLGHVHVAEIEDRGPPRGASLLSYLETLRASGYAGRVSIEAGGIDGETCGPALDFLRQHLG